MSSNPPWVVDSAVSNSVSFVGSVFTILMWLAPVRDVWTGAQSIFMTEGERIPASSLAYVAGTPNRTIKKEFGVFTVVLFIAAMIWIATGSNEGVGYIAMCVNILMYYGPLAAARQIIRARSPRGLPLPPLVMQLVASVIWSGWAIYLLEVPIIIPNVLGAIFAALQILLWCWASRQEKKINAGAGAVGDLEFQPVGGDATAKVTSRRASAEGLDGQVLDDGDSRRSVLGVGI